MTKSRHINNQRMVWTDWHKAIVLATYQHTANQALMRLFGCSRQQIYSYAHALGIKKSSWFFNKHPTSGTTVFVAQRVNVSGQFSKGHIPHNKGLKGWYMEGCEKSWFSKGHRPYNTLPVGHVRHLVREGYYEVKISNTGHKPTDWVPVHRLVWQRLTGKPIPNGHVVVYADGNYENYEIANLQCITKQQNMIRNSIHAYGPEIAKIYQLRGQISRQINKRTKQHEQCTNPIPSAI